MCMWLEVNEFTNVRISHLLVGDSDYWWDHGHVDCSTNGNNWLSVVVVPATLHRSKRRLIASKLDTVQSNAATNIYSDKTNYSLYDLSWKYPQKSLLATQKWTISYKTIWITNDTNELPERRLIVKRYRTSRFLRPRCHHHVQRWEFSSLRQYQPTHMVSPQQFVYLNFQGKLRLEAYKTITGHLHKVLGLVSWCPYFLDSGWCSRRWREEK